MNHFLKAEQAVYAAINQQNITKLVKSMHLNIKSLKEYGDKLPAIGIKAMELKESDEGTVLISGVCEVVAQGEYATANRKAEEIATALYDLITNRLWGDVDFPEGVNDITTSGMREIIGEDESKRVWVCIVYVDWLVML